jgi:hypothetical protein
MSKNMFSAQSFSVTKKLIPKVKVPIVESHFCDTQWKMIVHNSTELFLRDTGTENNFHIYF